MSVMHFLSTKYIMDTSCPSKHWSTIHPRNDACFLNCRTENCQVCCGVSGMPSAAKKSTGRFKK